MANLTFDQAATEAEKDIILRRRRSYIYSYFAQSRDEQEPDRAKELYDELIKINSELGEDPADEASRHSVLYSAATDNVNHPSHYNSGSIECIDAMKAMLAGYEQQQITTRYYWHFLAGQVLKYLWRWPLKERPLQDLKKARWYLERLIDDVESQDKNYAQKEISE